MGSLKVQYKSNTSDSSNKLHLDKYYTDMTLAKYCIDKTVEIIGKENITEFLEPSAGNGSFSLQIDNCRAYDLEPEHESVIEQDYLKLQLSYQRGRVIIGNPPFGSKMSLAQKFYKKSTELGDYIAFILPISQLNNPSSLYLFDLIYSEDLGVKEYSDRNIHCCFNIYRRPKNGLNTRQSLKLQSVEIVRQDSRKFIDFEHDIRMCYWGDATAGRILSEGEHYSAEYKIKVHDELIRDRVIEVLSEIDWKAELNSTAMLKIQQFHIIQVLKRAIPGIT